MLKTASEGGKMLAQGILGIGIFPAISVIQISLKKSDPEKREFLSETQQIYKFRVNIKRDTSELWFILLQDTK